MIEIVQKSCKFASDFLFLIRIKQELTNWKGVFIMTEEQEAEVQRLIKDIDVTELMRMLMKYGNVQRLIKDIDVTELMGMLMKYGNRYSRRILKFFRWFCKYVPITIMVFHAYGMWDFSQHPREMFITNNENFPCYLFIYFMVYILPMVLILASRFFFLCWRYRIPFFYFFGVNAAHIVEWSWYTTQDMIDSCFTVMIVTAMFYIYGFFDMFISRTKLGRKICA